MVEALKRDNSEAGIFFPPRLILILLASSVCVASSSRYGNIDRVNY